MERTAGWQRAGDQACRKIFFLRGNTAAVTHKSLGEQDFWQPNIVFCICKAKLPLFTLNSSLLAVLVVKHWIRQAWALTFFFFFAELLFVCFGFFIYSFYYIEVCSLYSWFLESFYHTCMLNLSKAFSASIEIIICLYFSIC